MRIGSWMEFYGKTTTQLLLLHQPQFFILEELRAASNSRVGYPSRRLEAHVLCLLWHHNV